MANMEINLRLPRRFASLSEQFVMNDGIILMGGAAALLILFTQALIMALVVMYAINVFLNCSRSQSGMVRFFSTNPRKIAGSTIAGSGRLSSRCRQKNRDRGRIVRMPGAYPVFRRAVARSRHI